MIWKNGIYQKAKIGGGKRKKKGKICNGTYVHSTLLSYVYSF